MKRPLYIAHTWILTLCLFQSLTAEIHKVDSLAMLWELLPSLDEQSLVIFDRDDTLFQGIDAVNPVWREAFVRTWLSVYDEQKTTDSAYCTTLQKHANKHQPQLIDASAPTLIKQLQHQGVKVIMCTGGCYGTNTIGIKVEQKSIELLTNAGIDLSSTFTAHSGILLQKVCNKGHHPLFLHGALLCNTCNKGQALMALLDIVNWLPERIIFIDDKISYLQEIESAAKQLNISFVGLHYRASEYLPTPDMMEQCYSMSYLLKRDLV